MAGPLFRAFFEGWLLGYLMFEERVGEIRSAGAGGLGGAEEHGVLCYGRTGV